MRSSILALLWDIFELDLGPACDLWGWHPGYRAYSWIDGGTIAANISCRPLPLVVDGRPVEALQLHCVATRPLYRKRGLFTELMARVLTEADRRYDCVLLYSVIPELYRAFGFRPMPEHRFRGQLDATPAAGVARHDLTLRDPDDLKIIRGAFARRRPASRHLGLVDNGDVFAINAFAHPDWRLTWLPEAEALVVWERADAVTHLLDVVAARMPPTPILAAALDLSAAATLDVEILFPPDLIAGSFVPVPHMSEDGEIFCVRGPFAVESMPFMLPLTAVS